MISPIALPIRNVDIFTFTEIRTTTLTTTTTRSTTTKAQPSSIDVPVSSRPEQDTECQNSECIPSAQCKSYVSDSEKLKNLRRGTSEFKQLLGKLTGLVCNKSKRKICCKPIIPSGGSKGECCWFRSDLQQL